MLAEMPFSRAQLSLNMRSVDRDVFLTTYFERFAISAEIDCIAAAARGFATNRAVTAVEWIGVV
jgi:hypothetical protein